MALLFSCDGTTSTPDGGGGITVERKDITLTADTIGTQVRSLGMMNPDSTITITGLDPEKLYNVAFNGAQSAGTGRSISSTLSSTDIGTFFIRPDENGTASFSPRQAGYDSTLENVLIYERIREELRKGFTPLASVKAGFDAASVAIIDSNLTTIITAVILYQFGTGPVRGFAVSLTLGIIGSMFTAVFVSRVIFEYIARKRGSKGLNI